MKCSSRIFVLFSLLIGLNALSTFSAQAVNNEPSVVRSQLHGFSMYPTIKSGEFIVYQKTYISNLKPGDIVVFVDTISGERVCHRVVEVDDGVVKSKGDNNRFRDRGFISEQYLLGKVTHIGGRSVS